MRAMMLLRLSTLATGRTGVRPLTRARPTRRSCRPASRRSCHEYGSLGCSGDLAPLAHCALALMGEGPVRDASGDLRDAGEALSAGGHRTRHAAREGGARPDQRHGRHARHARAGDRRPARAARDRRRDGGDERRGPARHRRRVRRRPAGAAAAARARRLGRQRARAARGQRDRRQPPRPRGHAGAGRLLAALRAGRSRGRARHGRRTPRGSRSASWRAPSTTR